MTNAIEFAHFQIGLVLISYLAFSVLPFFCFLFLFKNKFRHFEMRSSEYSLPIVARELTGTLSTIAIFWALLFLLGFLKQQGLTKIYPSVEDKGYLYFILSVILMILAHDAYFYWTHRLMHRVPFLWRAHKVHHLSHLPTPLSTFSFHPVEGFIQMLFFILPPLVIPIHMGAMYAFFIFMILANSFGHLSYEFYPRKLYYFPLTRWFNAALHHSIHHSNKNHNFGIYYLHWDLLLGTLHPEYFKRYHELKKVALPSKLPRFSRRFQNPSIKWDESAHKEHGVLSKQ